MPKPNEQESINDYIQRCMSDSEMLERHPDEGNRYHACVAIWKGEGDSKTQTESNTNE